MPKQKHSESCLSKVMRNHLFYPAQNEALRSKDNKHKCRNLKFKLSSHSVLHRQSRNTGHETDEQAKNPVFSLPKFETKQQTIPERKQRKKKCEK
jgi:hypothetical protein